jgi:hypothetical protein
MTYEVDVSVCPSTSLSSGGGAGSSLMVTILACLAVAALTTTIWGIYKYFPQRLSGYTVVESTAADIELNRNHRPAILI